MIIKNMRWGYDGGGMEEPVENGSHVELMVADEDGKLFFIENNQFTDCMTVRIAPYPMFDICMQLMWEDTDFECESQKLKQICLETYEYDLREYEDNEFPEGMEESKFFKSIRMTQLALSHCHPMFEVGEDFEEAQDFIEEYLDQDLDDIEELNVVEEDDEDEDWYI